METFLMAQWLRHCAPNAGGPCSIPGQGLDLIAANQEFTKTQHSQININILKTSIEHLTVLQAQFWSPGDTGTDKTDTTLTMEPTLRSETDKKHRNKTMSTMPSAPSWDTRQLHPGYPPATPRSK